MNFKSSFCSSLFLAALCAQAAVPAYAASPKGVWQSAAGSPDETVFAVTGDSIINRRISTFAAPGVEDMWGIIRKADAAFTNFETVIYDYNKPGAQQSGGTYMNSPKFVAEELEWAGFDLVSLANNHANDFGVDGMRSTVEAISKTKLIYAGVGENLAFARAPGYLDTAKGRVALISTSS